MVNYFNQAGRILHLLIHARDIGYFNLGLKLQQPSYLENERYKQLEFYVECEQQNRAQIRKRYT